MPTAIDHHAGVAQAEWRAPELGGQGG